MTEETSEQREKHALQTSNPNFQPTLSPVHPLWRVGRDFLLSEFALSNKPDMNPDGTRRERALGWLPGEIRGFIRREFFYDFSGSTKEHSSILFCIVMNVHQMNCEDSLC